jgi:antitoxin MazE
MAKTVIKTRIIKIGNSQGVRLPKLLLTQIGLGKEVELEVQQDQIVIRPAQGPRNGWDAQFRAMAERGDDRLLDSEAGDLTTWDTDEWVW